MVTFHVRGDSAVNVRLDGRFVGVIRRLIGDNGGWRYHPRGAAHLAGEIFPTLDACKQSLQTQNA